MWAPREMSALIVAGYLLQWKQILREISVASRVTKRMIDTTYNHSRTSGFRIVVVFPFSELQLSSGGQGSFQWTRLNGEDLNNIFDAFNFC